MADGILGLLGSVGDKVQGLLSSPAVQGIGTAAAFGFNPVLGLLAAPGIKNARDRKSVENELMRQDILGRRRRIEAQQQLTGLLGQDTAVSAPIGLMNVEGGVDVLPAGRRVPSISTPGGRREALGLLSQIAPAQVAESLLSQPTAPQFRTDVGKLFGDLELAESQGNTQAVTALRSAIESSLRPEVNFDDLRAARNDTIGNSEPFLIARQGFNRVVASANSATPAGDLALTFGLMKILDPTSVVREGEQATVRNAGSIPERIRGFYNRILTGETLTPEQRADFLSQAQAQFAKVVEQQRVVIDDARSFAERNNLPTADVVPEFVVPTFTSVSGPSGDSSTDVDPFADAAGAAIERAGEIAGAAAERVTTGARRTGARIADIGRMSLEKLQQLDPAQMTQEQLEAARRRWEELSGG